MLIRRFARSDAQATSLGPMSANRDAPGPAKPRPGLSQRSKVNAMTVRMLLSAAQDVRRVASLVTNDCRPIFRLSGPSDQMTTGDQLNLCYKMLDMLDGCADKYGEFGNALLKRLDA